MANSIGIGFSVCTIVCGLIWAFAGASSFSANSAYISQYGGNVKEVLSAYKGNPKLKILNSDTPLAKIFDIGRLKEIAVSDKELDVPWFGQLMRYDAFMAFIYQIHYWLNEYNIEVII